MFRFRLTLGFIALVVLLTCQAFAVELTESSFDLERQKIRYENTLEEFNRAIELDQFEDDFQTDGFNGTKRVKSKSPAKAFFMSFAIPGLGQYYNRSKLKAAAFLGLEVAGWIFNRKLDGEGDDIKAEFEAFNRANWYRDRYQQYLDANWTPEEIEAGGILGLSHHLPDTRTQQYYEMTGKYDQFSWGWIDARLDGADIDSLILLGNVPVAIPSDESTVPHSDMRDQYEQMRYDSNQKYKAARRMASLILVNHLISGLEAFFAAKRHNKQARHGGESQWGVKAGLKSYRAVKDTPYLQLSYKF